MAIFRPGYFAVTKQLAGLLAANVAAVHLGVLVAPAAAAPLDGVTGVLLAVADSGQWAPVAFLCATMFAELVPLLPTQPISLAAGLLFGAPVGATLVLCGSTTACMCAYGLTKGPAKGLARWVMQKELKGPVPAALTGGKDLERGFPPAGDLEGGGFKASVLGSPPRGAPLPLDPEVRAQSTLSAASLRRQLVRVQSQIEGASFVKQCLSIAVLRLSPVVPFSVSNYLFGFTSVRPLALYAGTWLGLAPWMFFYCSLGAGARELLLNGEDFSTLLSGLLRDLGAYSGAISAIGLLTFVGLGGVFITQFRSLPKARGESMRED